MSRNQTKRRLGFSRPPTDPFTDRGPGTPRPLAIDYCVSLLDDYTSQHQLQESSFRTLYSREAIAQDKQTVRDHFQTVEWRFANMRQRRLVGVFLNETMNLQDWLGLRQQGHAVRAMLTTDFDAFRSKVDTIVAIRLAQPIVDEAVGIKLSEIFFALDPSAAPTTPIVLRALTQSTFEKSSLPFGFTAPKYVANLSTNVGTVMMPRYSLNLGQLYCKDLRTAIGDPKTPDTSLFYLEDDRQLLMKLRMLLLLRLENELHLTMLPDSLHGQLQLINKLTASLDFLDQLFRDALNQTVEDVARRGAIPEAQRAELKEALAQNQRHRAREIVKEWQISEAGKEFARFALQRSSRKSDIPTGQDTFIQHVKITEKLIEWARNGRLDNYRPLGTRDVSLPETLFKGVKL